MDPRADPLDAANAAPPALPGMPGALTFDALRSRGLGLLQRLAGATWTDHNTHDPGITLLEALCYALTDLAYRTDFPVQDLLAGDSHAVAGGGAGAGASGLFTPAQVLPSAPVTLSDLRKLVCDIPGVRNAWIERVDEPLAYHDGARRVLWALPLAGQNDGNSGGGNSGNSGSGSAEQADASPNITALRPRGLIRVRIEKSGLGEDVDGATLVRRAAQRLLPWRSLGEDIDSISVQDIQPVALDGALEVAPGIDEAQLLATIYQALASHLSPDVPFRTLREMLGRGWRVDQIFEGPLLASGFLDPAEWAAVQRRSTLRLSDLIQVLMAVPGVLAVKRLGFLRDGRLSRDWLLAIDAQRSASFDGAGSDLWLERRGLRIDNAATRASASRLLEARLRQALLAGPVAGLAQASNDIAPPTGRNRQVARYLSIAHHLPAAYGVGPAGLSSQLPVQRLAQARQLKAYLLFFDQLLANQFAQLGAVGRLLSFTDDSAQASFAQAVPDDGGALQLDTVRRQPLARHQTVLDRITADPWGLAQGAEPGLARRHRLVDHLLARLGEQGQSARSISASPADGAAALAPPGEWLARSLRDKQAFLRDYPTQAVRRGVGLNSLGGAGGGGAGAAADAAADAAGAAGSAGAAAGAEATLAAQDVPAAPDSAGLSARLMRLLGLVDPTERPAVVEHILLRPLPGDRWQQGALMLSAATPDPFSLRLTVVLPAQAGRLADPDLRRHIAQTLADETPAHLLARLLWLDAPALAAFNTLHARWLALWCQAQRARFGGLPADGPAAGVGSAATTTATSTSTAAAPGPDHQWALRSARNRLIDLLGLGDTCPLTDLTVADGSPGGPIKVAFGRSARISIDESEAGMRYTLRGPGGQALADASGAERAAITVDGNSGRVQLETPAITDDSHFRIQVSKLPAATGLPPLPGQPPLLLTQGASVKVGLDIQLLIDLPGLPLLDATLSHPQPGDARVVAFGARVRVQVHASQEGVAYALGLDGTAQADAVIGNLGTIELLSPPLAADVTLSVQATKTFTGGAGGGGGGGGGAGGGTGGGTGGAQDQQWLSARLRVAVKANTALQALAQPGPVIDSGQASAALRLPASQAGVAYRLFARRVRDAEWRRDGLPDSAGALLRAQPAPPAQPDQPDQPDLPAVGLPLRPDGWLPADGWRTPDGFVAVGDAPLAGTGAGLDLPLGAPADDAVYLVQASKAHPVGQTTISTDVGLDQAVLVLVRPSATPPLQLALLQGLDAAAPPELQVAGGQPGVYYHFTAQPDGPALPQPAYQHQADERDPTRNKGLGQMAIGIDWALARGRDPATEPAPGAAVALDQQPVPTPRLRLSLAGDAALAGAAPLAADAVLAVSARRAMTGLDAALAHSVQLRALPPVRVEPARVAPGASAQVQVASSALGDLHQLQIQGRALADPAPGTGAGLQLDTGPVLADSVFELVISLAQPGTGLPLQRRLALAVTVLPRADLALAARRDSLAAGESTDIVVAASQPGVAYQLRADAAALGVPVAGTGAEINLPTGAITTDARFTVAATRTDDALASVLLAAEVRITLRAAG